MGCQPRYADRGTFKTFPKFSVPQLYTSCPADFQTPSSQVWHPLRNVFCACSVQLAGTCTDNPAPDGWDIPRPMWRHMDRWCVWIQWVHMQLTYSICTRVQEKAASVGWSKCSVPNPGTPPHHWDGKAEVDSLIPASCWACAYHTPVQPHSTGKKVRRRRRNACSWQGTKGNHGLPLKSLGHQGKSKGNTWVRTVLWRPAVHLTQNLLRMWRTLSQTFKGPQGRFCGFFMYYMC